MKWFYNLKVSAKLIIGFVFVAVIAGVIGIFAMVHIQSLNKSYSQVYEKNAKPVSYISKAGVLLQRQRVNLRSLIIDTNSDNAKTYFDKIESYDGMIKDDIEKYAAGISSDEERKEYENFMALKNKVDPLQQQIVSFIKAGQYEQARDVLLNQADPVSRDMETSTDKLIEINMAQGAKISSDNATKSSNANVLMSIIIIVGIAIAIAFGIFISRIIGNPIKQMVEVAEKISMGDMNLSIQANTKDEVGILMDSFARMVGMIRELVLEQNKITTAAADGKLDVRGDADKFQGSYRDIISGINNTLDAVVEPIKEASDVLGEMAKGNLQIVMKGDYKGDYAIIKYALNTTISAIVGYINEISDVLGEMANGNLNVGITNEYKGDFVKIKSSINQIVEAFNSILNDINVAAQQVASGSRQVSDSAQVLSQGSTEQASSIEELTASIEEISSQTKQNAQNANQANELAENAKEKAVQGNNQMQEMLKAMEEINESSNNISKIIKVIDEIAFQTNILALNAAVEAARAGQHGKGFAVVAEEVRNLAARSANAAKETTTMIEGSIKKAEGGTVIANSTAESLNAIVTEVAKAAILVSGIAAASNEQASGIAQINQGIMQVSQVVQTNSATSEESAAASEELSGQAEVLMEMVGKFKLKKGDIYTKQIEQVSPEILKMIENMKNPKQGPNTAGGNNKGDIPSKVKISLNDNDFGKY